MKKYIGTKVVQAVPWEREGRAGYKVIYADGYVSWSPADAFEEAYRQCDAMPFGLAIEAAKKGKKVARKGWNGKDMFVFLVQVDCFTADTDLSCTQNEAGNVETFPSLAMKTVGNKICVGWLASQTDMLADDWYIVE